MKDDQQPGCLGSIMGALGLAPRTDARPEESRDAEPLPYHLRDDFLSPGELNFYRVLRAAADDWAVVCPKVSLGDLFYARTGDYGANAAYRNKIDRKHIDFLLCDRGSLAPRVGVELDDASHERTHRRDRDFFVDGVFQAAGLPLVRIEVQASYNVKAMSAALRDWGGVDRGDPASPIGPEAGTPVAAAAELAPPVGEAKQVDGATPPSPLDDAPPGQPMVLREVKKDGPHKGKKFWGCRDFPHCRGLREYLPQG